MTRFYLPRLGMLLGIATLLLHSAAGGASGTRQVGSWVVVSHDKADGRMDVAAITSEPDAPFGIAIRCIGGKLSAALVPLRDDGLFGARNRIAPISIRPLDRGWTETTGWVADDRGLHLAAPAPLLAIALTAEHMAISVSASHGPSVEASFELRATTQALADLVRACPAG